MSNAIDSSHESNPSRRICNLRAATLDETQCGGLDCEIAHFGATMKFGNKRAKQFIASDFCVIDYLFYFLLHNFLSGTMRIRNVGSITCERHCMAMSQAE